MEGPFNYVTPTDLEWNASPGLHLATDQGIIVLAVNQFKRLTYLSVDPGQIRYQWCDQQTQAINLPVKDKI